MKIAMLFAGVALIAAPTAAAPVDDAVKAVTTVLDQFNAGDVGAFVAAHRDGAVIIDEFAPYMWGGSGSVKTWLDDYGKDAAARHITDGHMDYGKPLQANSDGWNAYVVLPTTYTFKMDGKPMKGASSMTFMMTRGNDGWKIASWAYAGAAPVAAD